MSLPILDIFVLSMLDRGAQSPYELQREAGISLGASLPSLRRLTKSKLVSKKVGKALTNRPRHEYRLTAAGKQQARAAWKPLLNDDPPTDVDSILRIADMAAHYRADKAQIRSFVKRASQARYLSAQQAGLTSQATRPANQILYASMRSRCDEARLQAEADVLLRLAESFVRKGPKGLPEGQQPLL